MSRDCDSDLEVSAVVPDVVVVNVDVVGMDVPDVKNVFQHSWSIEMFTRLVWSLQIDPKLVYKW